jgi:hypothetical protein
MRGIGIAVGAALFAGVAYAFAKPKKKGGAYLVTLQSPAPIVGNDANLNALARAFDWPATSIATWSISSQMGMNVLNVVFLANKETPRMPAVGLQGTTDGVPWKVTGAAVAPYQA